MLGRQPRYRDAGEYIQFMRRVVRAAGDRVGDADPDQLRELLELRAELDAAIANAVAGLRANGSTWADIGSATGTSRQAAHEKWGRTAS